MSEKDPVEQILRELDAETGLFRAVINASKGVPPNRSVFVLHRLAAAIEQFSLAKGYPSKEMTEAREAGKQAGLEDARKRLFGE